MAKRKKVLVVLGTRPECIKLAPVIRELRGRPLFDAVVCATGQHREMLDQVVRFFDIPVDHDLDVMSPNQDLFDLTAALLKALKPVLLQEKPDIVLAQGDTTTTMTACLAAFYRRIPIGHVEAGLRTRDKYLPYPEEKNRQMATVLADYHFAPTACARSNLLAEGIPEDRVWVTGNTIVDALRQATAKAAVDGGAEERLRELGVNLSGARLVLVTGHRRESFGDGFQSICQALKEIARRRTDVQIVYPVHLNPNVQRPVYSILGDLDNVLLTDPVGYEDFVLLMQRSHIILTDSGGIQEEAPSLGKPVLVMRQTTERPEGIEAGVVRLVGTQSGAIVENALDLLDNPESYRRMASAVNPYGDGQASRRIADILAELL